MFIKSLIMSLANKGEGSDPGKPDLTGQDDLNGGLTHSCPDYFRYFDDAPVPYLIIDEEGFILQANQAASGLLADLEILCSKDLALISYIYHEDRNKFDLHRKQMLKMGGRISRELRIINRSGEQIPVSLKMNVLKGDTTGQDRFGVVLLDIGESKQAEEILTMQVEAERIIASTSSIFVNQPSEQIAEGIIYALKQTGIFLNADQGVLFRFGANEKTLKYISGWSKTGAFSLPERCRVIEADRYPWLTKQILANEIINISSLSELPPEAAAEYEGLKEIELKAKAVLAIPVVTEKRVIGFICYTAEEEVGWSDKQIYLLMVISELLSSALVKQQSKIVLQKSEARYRWLLETLQEGVWGIDSKGRTNYVNKPMAEMLGYRVDEMIGKSLLDFMGEEEKAAADQRNHGRSEQP